MRRVLLASLFVTVLSVIVYRLFFAPLPEKYVFIEPIASFDADIGKIVANELRQMQTLGFVSDNEVTNNFLDYRKLAPQVVDFEAAHPFLSRRLQAARPLRLAGARHLGIIVESKKDEVITRFSHVYQNADHGIFLVNVWDYRLSRTKIRQIQELLNETIAGRRASLLHYINDKKIGYTVLGMVDGGLYYNVYYPSRPEVLADSESKVKGIALALLDKG